MSAVVSQTMMRCRVRFFGGRTALFVAFVALAMGIAAGGYEFLASVTVSRDEVTVGPVADFPPQTVTYVPEGHFFLVRFDDDQFVALYAVSPWMQRLAAGNPEKQHCAVRWYYVERQADGGILSFSEPDEVNATPLRDGVFQELCSGWRFDQHGYRQFGASASLDRYPVHITNGAVVVNTSVRDNRWWTLSPSY